MPYILFIFSLILCGVAIWRIKIWTRKQRVIALAAFYSLFLVFFASFAVGNYEMARQRENEDPASKKMMKMITKGQDADGNYVEPVVLWGGKDISEGDADFRKVKQFVKNFEDKVLPKLSNSGISSLGIEKDENMATFLSQSGKIYRVNLRALQLKSYIVLFNGRDAPLIWDITKTDGFQEAVFKYLNVK